MKQLPAFLAYPCQQPGEVVDFNTPSSCLLSLNSKKLHRWVNAQRSSHQLSEIYPLLNRSSDQSAPVAAAVTAYTFPCFIPVVFIKAARSTGISTQVSAVGARYSYTTRQLSYFRCPLENKNILETRQTCSRKDGCVGVPKKEDTNPTIKKVQA